MGLVKILVLLTGLILGHYANANWYNGSEIIMGTDVSVRLWHEDSQQAEKLIQEIWSEMHRIDKAFSTYNANSLISKINRQAGQGEVVITKELHQLLNRSLYFSTLSNGLFDISYASVGHLYHYQKNIKPTEKMLVKALRNINYRDIIILSNPARIKFKNPELRIDLGGIAKGYAVDQCIKLLKANNIESAVVTAGGDSRYIGMHQDRPWHVGIKHPRQSSKNAFLLPISDAAISTSGDYERYFLDENNQRHHHILHPETGKSPADLLSVTIIGEKAIDTDALSTTLFVAGVSDGLAIINKIPDYDAIFIDKNGHVYYSDGLTQPDSLSLRE